MINAMLFSNIVCKSIAIIVLHLEFFFFSTHVDSVKLTIHNNCYECVYLFEFINIVNFIACLLISIHVLDFVNSNHRSYNKNKLFESCKT